MGNIQPRCRALVIAECPIKGMEVGVVRKVADTGETIFFPFGETRIAKTPCWEIDTVIDTCVEGDLTYIPESALQRIDDNDKDQVTEWDANLFIPDDLRVAV